MNARFPTTRFPGYRRLWLAAAALALVAGCLIVVYAAEPHNATLQIRVDDHVLEVEVASTPTARGRGLMWRTEVPDGTGMLFLFDRPQYLSFWMRDTLIDLDIGFFGEDRRLQQIETMRALDLTRHRSRQPAHYALEVRRGWYTENNVRVGAQLHLPQP